MRELTRQRLSFNTAWNASLRAEVKHAGEDASLVVHQALWRGVCGSALQRGLVLLHGMLPTALQSQSRCDVTDPLRTPCFMRAVQVCAAGWQLQSK
jgi:hypothetical protein